jgi:hypothetical protein
MQELKISIFNRSSCLKKLEDEIFKLIIKDKRQVYVIDSEKNLVMSLTKMLKSLTMFSHLCQNTQNQGNH